MSNKAEDHVILFSGGHAAEANHPFYYYDIKRMYEIIVTVCGVSAENVYILYADGEDSGVDNSAGENSDMSFAADSTVMAATAENLRSVFGTISACADDNDHFLFYSSDHGMASSDGSANLCGWGENISAAEFSSYASSVTAGYQTYLMSQCYSWGMLEDITVSDRIFCGASAAADKSSHTAVDNATGIATAGFSFSVAAGLSSGITGTHDLFEYTLANNRYAETDGSVMAGGDFSIFGYGAEVPCGECTIEISANAFADSLVIEAPTAQVDIFNMKQACQMRVQYGDAEWSTPEALSETVYVNEIVSAPEKFVSVSNGVLDLFFAAPSGVWGAGYGAQHQGQGELWQGTGEIVLLEGKNRISDVFEGSSDANILVLTDDANGDALFADDLYSDLPEASDGAPRVVKIKEIRAGAGDDIVDMTSQRFVNSGGTMTIYGGGGDDTIWAGAGNNTLFGDGGNDRIVGGTGDDVIAGGAGDDTLHGGGGSDIFTFGSAWGNDTVTQLAAGEVTLHFVSGSLENWNSETLTYTQNGNSVKVSGIAADQVTLKFGNDGTPLYSSLALTGAFADSASQKVFETGGIAALTGRETILTNAVYEDQILIARTLTISNGDTANNITLSSGGNLYISSGGVANSTTVNDYYGRMYIKNGGVANSTIMSGGFMQISSGGTANSTTMPYYNCYMYISSGGVANSTTMSGGYMYISSGGVANSTTMSGGKMYIASGGTASCVDISSKGRLDIRAGGKATEVQLQKGGCLNGFSFDGDKSFAELNGGPLEIESNVILNFEESVLTITDGSAVENLGVHSSGFMHIFSGGTVNSTTVNSGGFMQISSGAVANETTVKDSGYMHISSGGVANSTTVRYGSMHIFSGGVANSTTVDYEGDMYISSGGVANSTTVNSQGDMWISSGGVANSTTMSSGGIVIFSGGVANSTTVIRGSMRISSGGVANSTTMSRGTMYISSGGAANSTTMSGGYMSISYGGTATQVVENGGYVEVAEGAKVEFASHTIENFTLSGSAMTVHSNTVANSTTMSWGSMYIFSGGVANSTTVNYSGYMHISSGGVANSTTMTGGGYMAISSGGVANSTTMSGGVIVISSGAVANSTTVNFGGHLYISSGGVAEKTVISAGGSVFFAGGTLKNTEIAQGASAVLTGGIAEGLFVNSNVFVTANNMAISDLSVRERGAVYASGGTVDDATVENLAILQLCSGTEASDTTVKSGGHLYIGSGAVHTGRLTVESGATVLAFTGSELNFTIDGMSSTSAALVNDLSAIAGNISYSITVSAGQGSGVYRLAGNVKTFTHDVLLEFGEETLEGFNVGETFESGGTTFALSLEDDMLLLEISAPVLYENALFDEADPLSGAELFSAAPGADGAFAGFLPAGNDPVKNGSLA